MPTSTSPALRFQPPAGLPGRALRLTIAGGPRAPERARAWVRSAARPLPDDMVRNLLLLTSELVNNSVVHGHAGEDDLIELELRTTPTHVCAQVSDLGAGFAPTGRGAAIDEPGGWGLVLVERIASRWGVERGEGTRVWFELPRS